MLIGDNNDSPPSSQVFAIHKDHQTLKPNEKCVYLCTVSVHKICSYLIRNFSVMKITTVIYYLIYSWLCEPSMCIVSFNPQCNHMR